MIENKKDAKYAYVSNVFHDFIYFNYCVIF